MRSSKTGRIGISANPEHIMWLAFWQEVLVSNKSLYDCGLVAILSYNRPTIQFRCHFLVASGLQLAIGFRV